MTMMSNWNLGRCDIDRLIFYWAGIVRNLRSKLSLAAAVIGLFEAAQPAQAQQTAQRPNIIYIVADDLGWKDVGFHGSDIRTPNIDQLAQGGAQLDQFYVQPMCTPTRATLLTGRYPLRYGLQTLVIPAGILMGCRPTSGCFLKRSSKWVIRPQLSASGILGTRSENSGRCSAALIISTARK